jgi:hypothetical protein
VKHELINRYIYAVVRHLPQKQRAEVDKELESLISDMLDERCGDIVPTDKDVRVVLTELGLPDELAAEYSGEEKKSLISGAYFIAYKRILRIVLPIVAGAVALGMVISALIDLSGNPAILAFRLIVLTPGGMIGGMFQAFAIVTFIFAVLERTKADLSSDYLSNLPLVPKQIERIKPFEPIVSIIFSVAAAVLFLGFPQIIGGWRDGDAWLPVLNVDVVRSFWPFILLWVVLSIAKESVSLIEGRYTRRLIIAKIAANVLIIGSTAVVFLNNDVVNPEFVQFLSILFDNVGNEFIASAIIHFNVIFVVCVFIALTIEIGSTIIKTMKAYKNAGQ